MLFCLVSLLDIFGCFYYFCQGRLYFLPRPSVCWLVCRQENTTEQICGYKNGSRTRIILLFFPCHFFLNFCMGSYEKNQPHLGGGWYL